jgi:hypothetical protein
MKKVEKSESNVVLLQIILSFAGTLIVAYFGYLGIKAQAETPIHATQTAEAKLTKLTATMDVVNVVSATSTSPSNILVASPSNTPDSIETIILPANTLQPCIINNFSDEDKTKLNWAIASNSDSNGTEQTSLDNGKYVWSMNALTPILYPKQLILNQGVITQNRNYELEFEIQKTVGADSVRYGLILNQEAHLKRYTIMISPTKQELTVYKRTPDASTQLIPTVGIPSINKSGINKLKLVVNGANYQMYINGEFAREFTDIEYQSGIIKLATEITETNSDVTVEVDNFRLCNIP